MGQIIILSLGGSLFQNICIAELSAILPGVPEEDIVELTTGTHTPIFDSLDDGLQAQVVYRVTLAIRNVYYVIMAASAAAFITSLFLSVSLAVQVSFPQFDFY